MMPPALVLERVNAAFGWRFSSFSALIERAAPPGRWRRLHGWEHMDDPAFLELIDDAPFLAEALYVVTDESYAKDGGAFVVQRNDLRDFVLAYPEGNGVTMFNNDTFIIGILSKVIWMWHHEGAWTLIDRRDMASN